MDPNERPGAPSTPGRWSLVPDDNVLVPSTAATSPRTVHTPSTEYSSPPAVLKNTEANREKTGTTPASTASLKRKLAADLSRDEALPSAHTIGIDIANVEANKAKKTALQIETEVLKLRAKVSKAVESAQTATRKEEKQVDAVKTTYQKLRLDADRAERVASEKHAAAEQARLKGDKLAKELGQKCEHARRISVDLSAQLEEKEKELRKALVHLAEFECHRPDLGRPMSVGPKTPFRFGQSRRRGLGEGKPVSGGRGKDDLATDSDPIESVGDDLTTEPADANAVTTGRDTRDGSIEHGNAEGGDHHDGYQDANEK